MPANDDHSASATSIPVTVVSNSMLLREGIVSLLAQYIRIHMVGTYTTDFSPQQSRPNPNGHVVLLDCTMGQAAALTWTRWWCRLRPPAKVLVMELTDDKEAIINCIEAGASGYTLRGASMCDVANAIQDAHRGQASCSPQMTAHLFARLAAVANEATGQVQKIPLTQREIEVLTYVSQGFSNKEIAATLFIELYTVKNHVHNILEKLNVRHRREAARIATASGWLPQTSDASQSKHEADR